MTATDRLRAMLDERGVGCVTDDGEYVKRTTWHGVGDKRATFIEYVNGECRFAMDDYNFTPEQAIAATLGGGKLTAEQVKDAWCANLKRDCLYDPPTPDWQAIADELNATLGHSLNNPSMSETLSARGTCKNKATSLRTFWCDCCDCALEDWMDVGGKLVNGLRYCPNCGRKVEG